MRFLPKLFLTLNILMASNTASATSTKEAEVEKLLKQYISSESPGFSIGIAHKGQPVFVKGYGMADLEQGTANTPDTVFHVASVSKQFAAFAIAILEKEGKLKLDDDIRNYLPYVPDFGHTITIRHLILHTSGLRDQWELFGAGGMDEAVQSKQQIINMVSRQTALNFTPGSEYLYCNTGYTLLGEIVEVVSGETLREFTTNHIFKPLGMTKTFFFDDITEIVPNRAHSYSRDDEKSPWKRALLNINNVGATSLHTTVGDMLIWINNLRTPTVGDKALIKQISTAGSLNNGNEINYGFALYNQNYAGHIALGHGGADAGFRASFNYFPAGDLSIMLAANTPDLLDRPELVTQIANIYLGTTNTAAIPASISPETEILDALVGTYQDRPFDKAVAIKTTDGNVTFGGKPITFRVDGTFDMGNNSRIAGDFFKPIYGKNNSVTALQEGAAGRDGRIAHWNRIQSNTVSGSNLQEIVGNYRSKELDATYTVSVDGETLTVRMIWFNEPIPFEQVSKDTFSSQWFMLNVKRNKLKEVSGIYVSGGRARNLLFEKVN